MKEVKRINDLYGLVNKQNTLKLKGQSWNEPILVVLCEDDDFVISKIEINWRKLEESNKKLKALGFEISFAPMRKDEILDLLVKADDSFSLYDMGYLVNETGSWKYRPYGVFEVVNAPVYTKESIVEVIYLLNYYNYR